MFEPKFFSCNPYLKVIMDSKRQWNMTWASSFAVLGAWLKRPGITSNSKCFKFKKGRVTANKGRKGDLLLLELSSIIVCYSNDYRRGPPNGGGPPPPKSGGELPNPDPPNPPKPVAGD